MHTKALGISIDVRVKSDFILSIKLLRIYIRIRMWKYGFKVL